MEFKKGDKVDYHEMFDGPITSTGHTVKAVEHAPNNYGCDVAWITGKSGCIAMRCLSKAKEGKVKPSEIVDVIASGYEFHCPRCQILVKLIESTDTVQCPTCTRIYSNNGPEHALA